MSPQVSVIIPVYNTARYLCRCCESLFGQTLSDMEFVFVDDASSDNSGEVILQVLANFPDRIHQVRLYTHDVHQGVGATRQHGLEVARGEYVIHCDSDDWVEASMYEQLYNHAKKTGADVVSCGYEVEPFGDGPNTQVSALSPNYDTLAFSIGPQTGSLCNKLVRRQFIEEHHLQIPKDICWGEDLCFSLKALILSKKTERIDQPLYHYVQQKDSITHDISPALCQDLLKCGSNIESFLREEHLLPKYEFQLNWLKFQLKQYLLIYPETRDVPTWSKTFPESNKHICRFHAPFYLKMASWLISHHLSPVANILLLLKDKLSTRIHS